MNGPVLPPLLTGIEDKTPFETAVGRARSESTGAGELFWSPDSDSISLALVLEPEVDSRRSLEMFTLAMVATGDSLGALTPPKVAVQFRLPGIFVVNGGTAGKISVTMADTGNPDDTPKWLIIHLIMALKRDQMAVEPGHQPDTTSLDEEGCETLTRDQFIESWARHLLSWLAIWNDDGFAPVARAWKFMAEDEMEPDTAKLRVSLDKQPGAN